jgi:zinc protease
VPDFDEQAADVSGTTLQQLKDFHQTFYGADHAQLAVVGNAEVPALKAKLEALFGKFDAKTPFERVKQPFVKIAPEKKTVEMPDKANAFYGTGTTLKMKDTDADYPAMMMADFMLGGGFLTGRVTKRLREHEGLSYYAGTIFRAPALDDGAVEMGMAIYKPDNVKKVETGFTEELERAVTGGFAPAEVKDAVPGLLQQREAQRQSDPDLAQMLVRYLFIDRKLDFDKKLDESIRKLDAKKVSAALKAHLDPKQMWSVEVGDFKTLAPPQ